MSKEFEQCQAIIDRHQRFVLTTHVNPDPDAIGSELALARFLASRGKTVSILNHSATPLNCAFLDPENSIIQFDPTPHGDLLLSAEVLFVLDANHPDRLESLKPFVTRSKATIVCIDHHLDKAEFAHLYIIDEASTATGEILYHLLLFLDAGALTKEIAEALYTAIMTDTGSFRFPKTNAEVHRVVADLIDHGADPVRSYQQVYEQLSAPRIQLLGLILSTLRLTHDDKVAYVVATKDMFSQTGTTEEDTENIVTYTLGIRGVQIGLLFTELPGAVKVSLRSKGDIEVNRLAQQFGGNGHQNAAGARIRQAPLQEVITSVLAHSKHYIR